MNSYAYWPGRVTARWMSPQGGNGIAPTARAPLGLRLCFLLFVFTVPIEALNLSLNLGPISIARFAGFGLFALSALHSRRSFSVVPGSLWCFAAYLANFLVRGLLSDPLDNSTFRPEFFTLAQLLIFFWIASNLFRDQKFSGKALLTYAFSTTVLSLGILLNLPGFSQQIHTSRIEGERVSALGVNSNYLGFVLSLAILIFMGTVTFKKLRSLLFVFPLTAVLAMMVQTASRGAVVSLIAGVSCFFATLWPLRRRPLVAVCAGVGVAGLLFFITSNPGFITRWTRTAEGDSAGRDHILRDALPMLSERPFFGWGPTVYRDELTVREKGLISTDWRQTPHNLILELLLQVGLVGAIPFFIGLILVARKAWKARKGELGMLPLALLMTLFIGNQFHQYTQTKPMWLVLAFCAAASTTSNRKPTSKRLEGE